MKIRVFILLSFHIIILHMVRCVEQLIFYYFSLSYLEEHGKWRWTQVNLCRYYSPWYKCTCKQWNITVLNIIHFYMLNLQHFLSFNVSIIILRICNKQSNYYKYVYMLPNLRTFLCLCSWMMHYLFRNLFLHYRAWIRLTKCIVIIT